ncbi:hypothetical protein SAMN04489725_10735 [Alicyclobacillus hesperidum]|uniref:Uncharacterized protein n=1 Tax=Alicyclobacillus hesperidum TaxID=89784 RepID=A0A1H2U3K3_9BACL|nr:hypothetical protein SAMN04489725_10735 [Alicyclobacillus hesperidum]
MRKWTLIKLVWKDYREIVQMGDEANVVECDNQGVSRGRI